MHQQVLLKVGKLLRNRKVEHAHGLSPVGVSQVRPFAVDGVSHLDVPLCVCL